MRRSKLIVGSVMFVFVAGAQQAARAAGIEHPDLGTVALGRGGAYAADPEDGLALQYNPAGFAKQRGLRVTVDGSLSWQALTFTPAGGGGSASNGAPPFLDGAVVVSYGLGKVGPLSDLAFAAGLTGPSAIGKLSYPADGPQRYALISTDFLILYPSIAASASFRDWLSAGVTFQLVKGWAKFNQAVWAGMAQGTDPGFDAVAHVDVTSGLIPTAVLGVTVRPIPRLAIGLSYRPRYTFDASGTLTTDLPASAMAIGAHQVGTSAGFVLHEADVVRLGALWTANDRWLVEGDVVYENWGPLSTIEIHPQNIRVMSDNFGTDKALQNIIFPKDFEGTFSVRAGGDYAVLPGRLTVRGGLLYERSAIPLSSTNVDFGNWDRYMIAIGASVPFTVQKVQASVDIAYAHHFIPSRTVTNSTAVQVVSPCLTPGCTDPAPTVIGNGTYDASLNAVSLSVRVALDARRASP
jgi:long-subunit fatty acid transport protein